ADNIDYDEIKHLIKDHTTPGSGKAVSIPGQGHVREREFEDQLFALLAQEHQRIDLFVRSKSGEIKRRLDHVAKQINQPSIRERPDAANRMSVRRQQKYGRMEEDVLKAGEEIRSLSRFVGAQRLAFTKLLKKYKKWAGSEQVERRFTQEVLNQPGNFSKADLAPLLHYWTDVLHAVREAFQGGPPGLPSKDKLGALTPICESPVESSACVVSQIQSAVDAGAEVNFDVALATLPLGGSGARAVYWVHQDQVVELQVLLLQKLKLFVPRARRGSQPSTPISPIATPSRRQSHETLDSLYSNDKAEAAGALFIDDSERYARVRSSTTVIDAEETPGKPSLSALGSARWNSTGEAVVVIPGKSSREPESVALKRKHLGALLDTTQPFLSRRGSSLSAIGENKAQADVSNTTTVEAVRAWLSSHEHVAPLAGVSSKRTRFVGLNNIPTNGVWATLDSDVHMKQSLHEQLLENDWAQAARKEASTFPHAVLEVRSEGAHADELIKVLDNSHLTERVRGFSLEAHAIWTCCKPSAMRAPYWLPMLDRDIRKLPAPFHRQRSRAASISCPMDSASSRQTSLSNTSVTDGGQTSGSNGRPLESSATSATEADSAPQTLSPGDKRKKRNNLRTMAAIRSMESRTPSGGQQRYWSEYDHPEDGSDDGDAYVIYVDPNASMKLPGQDAIVSFFSRIKAAISPRKQHPEEEHLISPDSYNQSSPDSSDGENSPLVASTPHYGSINRSRAVSQSGSQSRIAGAMDTLFGSPATDRQALLNRDIEITDVITSMELRQRERELTKFRLCVTSLAAAAAVLAVTWILAATSRKSLRREVDATIAFGIFADILFAAVGALCMLTRRNDVGWLQRILVGMIVAGVCLGDSALLVWMLT
ncbi:hypothetical protein K490DRAFT_44972, partial [Saccharata proteae CBS 121410]